MRKLISLIVAVLAAIIAIPLLGGAAIFGGGGTTCLPATTGSATTASAVPGPIAPGGPIPALDGWDGEQLSHVATILTVGNTKTVPPWGWVVATATAMQESSLRNLAGGADDSIGLFQQRPSQGWGTPEQLRDPAYQAGKFFDKLLTVEGWQQMPLTEAAQKVQRSAYPDAYAKHTAEAIRLVSHVGAALGLSTVGINPCSGVSAQGWTQPVRALVVSGFRTSSRPGHDGVDLGATRHTTIVAAASGTVERVRCNAIDNRTGGEWGCDRDGSPEYTTGCGMYVDLAHPGGIITRYCHMQTQPYVNVGDPVIAGQPIGEVGSTGHSSGPHLHYEVHINGDSSSSGAVSPEDWMAAHGAPLGQP
ncbi:M23 family metallopeptidase [Micromonospora sp. Llam7]|uniref:M23 family metallopeptidase n=1 Tax=Micromonospora tarapacensis TaxID=2835305 RepID=UPI001C82972D|nr:M23 family metallopeptidase [Micromonospora tarapacensis]MBX7267576.1 M23 family metallopeptidase [Micromonospora tarapacensis]